MRHIIVSSTYASAQTIVPILENVQDLASFSWNADKLLPAVVLECFHCRHPEAKLKVTYRNERGTPLDEDLLSSPQLHTLHISVGCVVNGRLPNTTYILELPALKDLLIRGDNLKTLRLCHTKLERGSQLA